MRPGTTEPGRYTLQVLVEAPTTNAHGFGGTAFGGAVGAWSAGTPDVLAGSVALARDASAPNPLTETHYTDANRRKVIRSTIVVDLARPASNSTLAVLVAKALESAHVGLPYSALSQAFMGATPPAPIRTATLTIAPWRRPAPARQSPAPARQAGAAAPPAPAPSPLPPTPPVPLSPLQRVEAGPVTESDDPARVGQAQRLLSPATLLEAKAGGDWMTILGAVLLGLAAVAVAVAVVSDEGD